MFWRVLREIAVGIPAALAVAVGAWVLTCLLGLLLTALSGSRYRTVRVLVDFYYMSVRGVPELVMLFVVFYGLHQYVALTPYWAAVVALGLAQSPFATEYFRASLRTVGRGQREAGLSVGLSSTTVMYAVIAPQALRFALTPMLNLFIGQLKFSSLASAIGFVEIIGREQLVIARMATAEVYLDATVATCILYIIIVIPISLVVSRLTARLNPAASSASRTG